MDGGSEGEGNRNLNRSPQEGPKKPKRQMKTPFQLEILEKTYASNVFSFWFIIIFTSFFCFLSTSYSSQYFFLAILSHGIFCYTCSTYMRV